MSEVNSEEYERCPECGSVEPACLRLFMPGNCPVGRDRLAQSVKPANLIAARLSEASLLMEGTAHPELADALRIGANEIERLQALLDASGQCLSCTAGPECVATSNPPQECPHAAPFKYCDGCVVTPCPVGLGGAS